MNFTKISAIILSLFFSTLSLSQVDLGEPDSQAVIIDMDDGSVIYGIISNRTEFELTIQSASLGTVTIPISTIKKTRFINDVRNILFDKDGYPVDFFNSTHYFLFPSGYSLRKGQSYYENIWVFANSYSYGVTDNFTISGGAEVFSLLFLQQRPLMYLSPKFSIPFKEQKGAFGISSTILVLPEDNFNALGFISGSLTLGSRNNNVSFGVGAGFDFDGGITDEIIPLTFSFVKRLSSKISLMSENWLILENDFNDSVSILSAGMRLHFKQVGNTLNLGLVRPIEDIGPLLAIPFVSATIAIEN